MELQTAKGVRDFPPEEQMLRDEIVSKLKEIFERYGFVPLSTPIVERYETLEAKYAGGDEILKETFTLTDQGGRKLGLRYDLTVPFARFIGMNPSIKLPFKRYQFGEVFRDGPIKLGRYREFMQCDIDIVGANSMLAEAQLIEIAENFFSGIICAVVIEVNNRKILDGLMESFGIKDENKLNILLSIDKLKKVGLDGVKEELKQKNLLDKNTEKLLQAINIQGSNQEKIKALSKIITSETGKKGLMEIEELLSYVKCVTFVPSLARGLSYYTGTIFEVFAGEGAKKYFGDNVVSSSLAAGGRYDSLISNYLGTNKAYPAVGISFGLEPIYEMMKSKRTVLQKTCVKVYVIPIKTQKECIAIAKTLRNAEINADMDIMERGVTKNLDYASALGIPYVILVGEQELKQNKVKLRDMNSGKEELLSLDSVIKKLA